ncbi:MAG: DUF6285 domain-containing protein [Ilumatobacteraceae bacterium]
MHQPPSAADLLRTVAETLAGDVVPATSGPAQHQARVAANIASIVARELELGQEVRSREHDLLWEIGGEEISHEADLAAAVAAALREGAADSDEEHERVRMLLTEIVSGDLSISKPGYDDWNGE